ncbi:translation protein, partial [Basidiobolus meristosporus CBS 931.73]
MGVLLQRFSSLSLQKASSPAARAVSQVRYLRTGPYAQKPLRSADKAFGILKKNPKQYTQDSIRTGAIGLKSGMTAIWDEWGVRVPVTVLHLKENQVVDRRTEDKHGYNAVQIGCYNKRIASTTRPLRGHFEKNGVDPKKKLMEFVVSKDGLLPLGTPISAAHFVPGQFVDVTATSLGKGFAGGMKRWGFKGLRATHGVSLSHRSIGSTGQRTDPGKVFKGKKMPGRLGGDRVTVQ